MSRLRLAGATIWNPHAYRRLHEQTLAHRADIVHFHNTFPLLSPSAWYAARRAGAAVVQTLHNFRLMCPAAVLYRDGHVCEQCAGLTIPFPAVRHRCYRDNRGASAILAAMLGTHKMARTYHRAVDCYIALSEFARAKMIQGGLPARKIAIKPNFIEPAPSIGVGAGKFALFVGRLTREKGVATLLDAWERHTARNPGSTGVKLLIAGDGPLAELVRSKVAELPRVEYVGRQTPDRIIELMRDAALLVFPSEWYEGMPRTLIESFACGTPALACDIGTMPEMIKPGVNGELVRPGEATELAGALDKLLADPARLSAMRPGARQAYEDHYTAHRNIESLLACYKAAIARRHPNAAPVS